MYEEAMRMCITGFVKQNKKYKRNTHAKLKRNISLKRVRERLTSSMVVRIPRLSLVSSGITAAFSYKVKN